MDPTSIRHALRKLPLSTLPTHRPAYDIEMPPPPYTATTAPTHTPRPHVQTTPSASSQVDTPTPTQRTTTSLPLLPEQDIDDSDLESADSDSDDSHNEDDTPRIHINAATRIVGANNRIAVPRIDSARLGHMIHSVLTQQALPGGGKVNITIKCGVTVHGNGNVVALAPVGTGAGPVGRASIESVVAAECHRKRGAEEEGGAELAKSPKRE